jgi:hypothetical protein
MAFIDHQKNKKIIPWFRKNIYKLYLHLAQKVIILMPQIIARYESHRPIDKRRKLSKEEVS